MPTENEFTEEEKRGLLSHAVHENNLGELHDPKAMFLHVHVGKASLGDDEFELSATMDYLPIVKHLGTGRSFTLSWKDLIELAIARDIGHPL